MTQEQIQQINLKLYQIMMSPIFIASKKRNNFDEYGDPVSKQWSHNIKPNRPCCGCKEIYPKDKMHRDEYYTTRTKNGKRYHTKNIVYRCDECFAKFKPRREKNA